MQKDKIQAKEWQALIAHAKELESTTLSEFFKADSARTQKLTFEAVGWRMDLSKQQINDTTLELLLNLADQSEVREKAREMYQGAKINKTEGRSVLHHALRYFGKTPILADGKDVLPEIKETLQQMEDFTQKLQTGKLRGYSGEVIRHIINIGIGGSDLGPKMVYQAMQGHHDPRFTVDFVSNIDSSHLIETLHGKNPAQCLFVIASKTFTTQETMTNATSAREWVLAHFHHEKAIANHFVALSTNQEAVEKFGILKEHTFTFWDWVGGRYSLTSAIGLSLMIGLGVENFHALRKGFYLMDRHFLEAPSRKNLPLLLALVGVWNRNFKARNNLAILPYSQALAHFPAFLQQADMESNGKTTDQEGNRTNYPTGPIIWGQPGTNGQHAFYQLLHQGSDIIPSDFIGFCQAVHPLGDHQDILFSNFVAQQKALAFGKSKETLIKNKCPEALLPFRNFEGNRPSTCLTAKKLTPQSLGSLISLYENKIFAQGILWNIFSFDQWGVELGKELAGEILPALKGEASSESFDASTEALIQYYLKNNQE